MLKLDINFVFQIINILVLYWLMKKFLFGPINGIMDKRKNTIEASLSDAEKKNFEALALKQQYEDQLEAAHADAAKIIETARIQAEAEHQKQLQEAQQEITRMMDESNRSLERQKKKAMQEAQAEIAGIALAVASKVVQKNLDDSTNQRLASEFLHEVGAMK